MGPADLSRTRSWNRIRGWRQSGPCADVVVTETLKSGWLRGAAVAAGPLLADGPIVLIAVTVFSELPPTVVPAISVVGGVFLLYLAITNAVGARRAKLRTTSAPRPGARGGLLTGRTLRRGPASRWNFAGRRRNGRNRPRARETRILEPHRPDLTPERVS
jgi:hypothetical protein